MNRSTPLRLLALAALPLAAAHAQTVYLNETFDTDTIGVAPVDTAQRRAALTTVEAGTGLIGTDNVARFNDNSGGTGGLGGALEYNIGDAPLGSAFISFDLFNNAANASGTAANPIIFGISNWNNASNTTVLSSNGARSFGLEFYQTGASSTVRLRNGTSSAILTTSYDMAALLSVSIFINDHDTNTLDYTLPGTSTTATLNANSFVIFINNSLLTGESVSGFALSTTAGVGNATGNATLGRLGFNSSSTNTADFLIDNLYASTIPTSSIPEPSSFAALAGLATLGLTASRRRRA